MTTPSRTVRLSSTGPVRETEHLLDALSEGFGSVAEAPSHLTSPPPHKAVHVDLETAVPSPKPAELAAFDAEGVSVRLCSEAAEDLDELHRWLSRSFKCGETAVDQDSLEFTVWVDQAPPQATEA